MAVTHTDPPSFDKIPLSGLFANASLVPLSETSTLVKIAGQPGRDLNDSSVPSNLDGQIENVLKRLTGVLEHVGAKKSDVVHIRYYVVDSLTNEQLKEFGPKFGAWLEGNRPAACLVKVTGLMNPKYLIEVEMTAVIHKDE
ncbi:hypothetical protein ACJ41O_006834 [Fusarium nematophilum]